MARRHSVLLQRRDEPVGVSVFNPYPDPMRYNNLYNNFIGIYGAPVNYVNNGTSLSATWFAPNKGYITLQYAPQYALGGQLRYFTTLTLGL